MLTSSSSGKLLGATLACIFAAGCQSPTQVGALFHRQDPAIAKEKPSDQTHAFLRQGTEVQWQVQTAQEQPGQVKNGSGIVAPDGTVEIGPYGTCKVSGLNLTQATSALEKHLAAYMTAPSVQLSMIVADEQPNHAAPPRPRGFLGQPALLRTAAAAPASRTPGETVVEVVPGAGEAQPVAWRSAQSGR